ncbi:MAG: bifunctional RNase H/acid phosphatase [Nocardioidaceae bacterium]
MAPSTNVIIEADGGSRGNPGPAGFGALLRDADTSEVIAEAAESIGIATNNVAEYRGLIAGLELYVEHAPDALLEVRMDSKLIIEQMAGRWKIKHPDMRPLAIQAQRLAPFGAVWTWVPRERNRDADRLANLAMDAAALGEVFDVEAEADSRPGVGHNQPGDPTPEAMEPPSPGARVDTTEAAAAEAGPRNPMLGWSAWNGQATTLIFLRHGVTVHTSERKFSGPGGDDPGLTDEGREQAERAAQALAADEGIDAILSSPLQRTRDTADIVAKALGLEIFVEDDFRECAFGEWDGLTLAEVTDRWPAEVDLWLSSMDSRPPGGESVIEVQKRVEEALGRTLSAYQGKTVVIVSHVTPIKLCVRYCLDAPLASINKMLLAPASFTTLSFYESGALSLRQFSALP